MKWHLAGACVLFSTLVGPLWAESTTAPAPDPVVTTGPAAFPHFAPATQPAAAVAKPIFAAVVMRTTNAELIRGDVVAFDENTVTINVKTLPAPVTHKWTELTTSSACTLRARLIDKTNAQDWLTLATFEWGMGDVDKARSALAQAVHLDATLKPKADALLKTPPGQLIKPPPPPPTQTAEATTPADSGTPPKGNEGELFPGVKGHKAR